MSKWKLTEIEDLYKLPFNDLIYKVQTIHRKNRSLTKFKFQHLCQ